MELKNVQRYANTYIENLLKKMKSLLKKDEDINFINELIQKNDSFNSVQNGRKEKDKHPILHFTPYELLVEFRIFAEKYRKLLDDNSYKRYNRNFNFENEFYAEFEDYDEGAYYIRIIPNNGQRPRENQEEKKIIDQLRNADAHGDIDVVLEDWVDGNTIFRFHDKYKMTEIREEDFQKVVKYLYSRAYNNIDMTDIFLLNKEATDELSPSIKNEEELIDFLNNRHMLSLNIKKRNPNKHEGEKDELTGLIDDGYDITHQEKIIKMLMLTDDRSGCTDKDIYNRIRYIITESESFKISEILEEDKKEIIDFVRKHSNFFKERVDIQRNLISEVLRRKYISEEQYELSKITKSLLLDNEAIQYFERKNIEYFDEDIEKQFEILSKIVFLTNKEKLFDTKIDYTQIDISKADIKHIKEIENSTIEQQFFRRLRNSFTHYRYEVLGDNNDGLNRRVRLWDQDGEELTFDAEIDLKDCIDILFQMEFLKEINDKYKEDDDEILEFSTNAQEEFDCREVSKNPELFQYLDEEKRNNRDIIESGITRDRSILFHIGENIENDREYMKDILIRYPDAIIYLNKYKADDEFVKIALSSDGFLIEMVNDKYKYKEEYVLLALENSDSHIVLNDIPSEILYDKEFIKKAILINPLSIAVTSFKNKDDEELAMLAVKGNGMAIMHISPRLKENREIAIEAIRNNLCARYFVSRNLYDDPVFCAEVENIEEENDSEVITSVQLEELTEEVCVSSKNEAEKFIDNIENREREENKSE